jgi:hypothetical protein
MKKVGLLLPVVLVMSAALAFGQLQAPGADNTPAVGQAAPDFEGPQGLGPATLGLKDFDGYVLLAFFPAAFTGG